MGISSKFIWTLGGVLLMSSGFAEQKEGDAPSLSQAFGRPAASEISRRLECVERKLDQISEKKVSDVLGGNNPPAFGCAGSVGYFTDISLLYWKAFNHGWTVAFEYRSPYQTPSAQVYTNLKPDEVHFDWSPGIRVGAGYNSGYDHWNVQGIYTWIRLDGCKSLIARDFATYTVGLSTVNLGIQPNAAYIFNAPAGVFRTLSAKWRLNHNVGDLQLARDFYITKALALQPILGLRFASLDQSMNTHFGQTVAVLNRYDSYHISNDFWGFGPRIGIDGKWTFPHNFGFTGLITGSLLYGKLKIAEHYFSTSVAGPLQETGVMRSSENAFAPNVQLILGMDWGICFNKESMYWGFNLGWELNYWWNQAHFDINREVQFPIEIQGITFRSDLSF